MGKKKSGSHGGEKEKGEDKPRAFALKVDMHCSCHGCIDKIRAAVNDITRLQGIETWDQSELETKGELRLVATADPEKLRHRLRKATRKNVNLVFPKDKGGGKGKAGADAAAQEQALLLRSLQQQQGHQYRPHNAWAASHLLPGGGWNAHGGYGAAAQSYPWAVQQPNPYADYPAAGAASWGPYPPVAQGYDGTWHGHGY